jgi:hypothetical protein
MSPPCFLNSESFLKHPHEFIVSGRSKTAFAAISSDVDQNPPRQPPSQNQHRVIPQSPEGSAVYDSVGFVKAFFRAFGRKKGIERRLFGKDGVKGAFFAFISTLDTVLPKPTIELGTNLRRSF